MDSLRESASEMDYFESTQDVNTCMAQAERCFKARNDMDPIHVNVLLKKYE